MSLPPVAHGGSAAGFDPHRCFCLVATAAYWSSTDRQFARARRAYAPRCILGGMTNNELAAFYHRYNPCCNEHRFDELAEFVARDVAIDGTDRGLDAYAAELRAAVRAFPDSSGAEVCPATRSRCASRGRRGRVGGCERGCVDRARLCSAPCVGGFAQCERRRVLGAHRLALRPGGAEGRFAEFVA